MPDFGDHTGDGNSRHDFYGTLDPYAPSVANGQISPAEWARYKAQRKRDAILGSILTVGGAMAAQPLANAIGIGATGGSATGGSALGSIPGGAPWAVTPYAGTASMVPTGAAAVGGTVGAGAIGAAGAGAGTAASEGARYLGLTPRDWLALAGTGIGTVGALTADRPNVNPTTATNDPQMKELMDLMLGRVRKSEPMYDSILAMANGLLPTQYQRSGNG